MRVSVIGLGYIGLPTAVIIASKGINVIGVDTNTKIIDSINNSRAHIAEPGIEDLLKEAISRKRLIASQDLVKSDVFIIAVPTPFKEEKKADLSYIFSAVDSIAPVLEEGNLIIIESTIPVGTTEKVADYISSLRDDLSIPKINNSKKSNISIAHCPERVLPGRIIEELQTNDRIIGGITENCTKSAVEFYKLFVKSNCLSVDSRTAEMCKLIENSFRDVNIAFANELSVISDQFGIDVFKLIELANRHPRVNILQPGPGVGGHCIAVDPWFIIESAPESSRLITTARKVNDEKPEFVLSQLKNLIKETGSKYSDLTISCFGLSFKPNIDDLRESPALEIAKSIESMGFKKVCIIEPNIKTLPSVLAKKNTSLISIDDGIDQSDILLLLVDHEEFISLEREKLEGKFILDTKGIWR